MVGKRATARIEILAFGIPRPHHATNSALRAVRALTELFILGTKDSNPQALNRTHLWIHWHNQTCCQLSEICVHQSNSKNFRNIVEAGFGVGLLAVLTVKPLLNRRKSVAAHLAVRPLANGCRVQDRMGFAHPSVGA
jgi:hypothetical protein